MPRLSQMLVATVISVASLLISERCAALDWGAVYGSQDNYDADRHNPFNQSPDFVGDGLDLSGVGVLHKTNGDNWWITMISDTYFLSAAHIDPTDSGTSSYTVNFFHDFADTSADETAVIDKDFHVTLGGSDLFLGRLTSAPSSAVKRYPLIQRNENTNYLTYIPNRELYLTGYRGGESGIAQTRLGLNNMDSVGQSDYGFSYNSGSGYGIDEATVIGGDSSAPTFVKISSGVFAIAGTHYTYTSDSSVSAHVSQIQSLVPSVQIATDLVGDLNHDYQVDATDFGIFGGHYTTASGAKYNEGDLRRHVRHKHSCAVGLQ